MANGYSGKILRIDLTSGKISIDKQDEAFYRTYMGGWGLVAYYLLKEVKKGTDALGPDNKLIFAPGVLTGVPLAGAGRSAMGAKSPITGGFGEGDVGGYFGAELAQAGWDGIIVEGKAEGPVYISIVDEKVEIKDGSGVWGKDAMDTQDVLMDELGEKKTRFAVIGKAGENLVTCACVMHDDNHAVGRAGLGAVMGSKNLKAVAVKAGQAKDVADRDKLKEITKWTAGDGKVKWYGMQQNGTDGGLHDLSEGGGLPTKNFKYGQFEGNEKITGQTMTDTILVKRETCYACMVRCKRVVEVKEGPFKADPKYGGPEYETAGALGSNCGIDNLAAVSAGNQICNANGLDTIAGGMMVSFAMECFENGIISESDTGGLNLRFGNADAMVKCLQMIVDREGIGDLLAQGYAACVGKWGPEAAKYAIQVKNQALPMHEPRFKFGLGLGYAISPTGADHVHNIHDPAFATEAGMEAVKPFGILKPMAPQELGPEKLRVFHYHTMTSVLKNMLGLCIFLPYGPTMLVDIVRAVTGWDTSLLEIFKAGERGMGMARAFNAVQGLTTKDDYLPDRFYEAFDSGPLNGVAQNREEFQSSLKDLYEVLGWDQESGAPTRAMCGDLGIDWVAEMLS
jgi:aldehyde:ferredoxin oxidoreductase